MVATAWSRDGNSKNTAEKTAGIKTPPENPCTTRKTSRTAKWPRKAQPIEAMDRLLAPRTPEVARPEPKAPKAPEGTAEPKAPTRSKEPLDSRKSSEPERTPEPSSSKCA